MRALLSAFAGGVLACHFLPEIPVGYRNRYRHPKPSVMAAYEVRKIKIYRTDADGMVQVDLPSLKVSAYRQIRPSYSMDRPQTNVAQDEQ